MTDSSSSQPAATNFIINRINEDLAAGKNNSRVALRFPPEPNGYLHIGHAKSICLNFGLAQFYPGATCNLRFDDTNPSKESDEFVASIQEDVRWLGYEWDSLHYASDYFSQLYDWAMQLIKDGQAYVCQLDAEEVRSYRGTLTEPGRNSPYRDRPIEESVELFASMRRGEMAEGSATLRAKIDMAAGNMNMRDPALYRIRKVHHHRTADQWCIYPLYDFTHALSDAAEAITHSLCTLEFQDHRPLYDWCVQSTKQENQPQQIEFARLNISHTITSKRKLKLLVDENHVAGWDDPRLPTLVGLRRRGVPPLAIRKFCEQIGVSKQDSIIDMNLFDQAVRDVLNVTAERRMAVLDPLKIVITNYPEDEHEVLQMPNHPQNPELGKRALHWSREIYIDRADFQEHPEKGFKRLSPGKDVRLMQAYVVRCDEVIKNSAGDIVELRCSYDPVTLGGKKPADGHKVKGIVQWLSLMDAVDAEVRIYDRLFSVDNPAAAEDFTAAINADSLQLVSSAKIEKSLAQLPAEQVVQFNRVGYFVADRYEHNAEHPVFNRVVALRDVWQKAAASA